MSATKVIVSATVETEDSKALYQALKDMGFVFSEYYATETAAKPAIGVEVKIFTCAGEFYLETGHGQIEIGKVCESEELFKQQAVAVGIEGFYPDPEEYGVPFWATDGNEDAVFSDLGLKVQEGGVVDFDFSTTNDDSSEHFNIKMQAPRELFEEYFVTELCKEIRKRKVSHDEMVSELEMAGFAVTETGDELIEAYANAIYQGDVAPEFDIDFEVIS